MNAVKGDVKCGNIFVYKLTCDNGGAPCVFDGTLSLAICKPRIRTSALKDDWIIGFGGRSVPELRDKLIYVARISEVKQAGGYYEGGMYADRPDCVYERVGSGYKYRDGKVYHKPGEFDHDLGAAPGYQRAWCLLSTQFVYFGGAEERPSIGPVRDIYENLPRDFKKNHPPEIRTRLEEFIVSAFAFARQTGPVSPSQPDTSAKCYLIEDEEMVIHGCSR